MIKFIFKHFKNINELEKGLGVSVEATETDSLKSLYEKAANNAYENLVASEIEKCLQEMVWGKERFEQWHDLQKRRGAIQEYCIREKLDLCEYVKKEFPLVCATRLYGGLYDTPNPKHINIYQLASVLAQNLIKESKED